MSNLVNLSSESPIRFEVQSFKAKNRVFDHQKMNEHVRVFDQSLNRNNEYQNL